MSNNYNYGPRMKFESHQMLLSFTPLRTTLSEYVDAGDMKEEKISHSESFVTTNSMSSNLNHYWKKVNSLNKTDSSMTSNSTVTSIPSAPKTFESSSNTLDGSTITPSTHSLKSAKLNNLSDWQYDSNRSDSSIIGNRMISLENLADSLIEPTETREENQCLSLQKQALDELETPLNRSINQFSEFTQKQNVALDQISKEGGRKLKNCNDRMAYLKESGEEVFADFDKKTSDLLDPTIKLYETKAKVEKFVGNNEEFYKENQATGTMISENERLLARIRQNLPTNKASSVRFPASVQEEKRLEAALSSIKSLLHSFPFDENERADFEYTIKKIEKDATFEKKKKCELIVRHLLSVMNNWEENQSTVSFDSDNWNSVSTIDSRDDVLDLNVYENGLYDLKNSSIYDSNLNDLEGELRSASIRMAVEGPNETIECSPWNSASNYSGWSSNSNSLDSIQPDSSMENSTLSSLSSNSIPNQTFDDAHRNLIANASTKTAYSSSSPVSPRPPRSIHEKSTLQSATGTRSDSIPSFNFSSVSLSDMVDEALHTAKDVAENQATHLMTALQNSARQCGVVFSDLMTAVSTSSESISDTQSSHHSIAH
ncbi:hypothetical protein CRE_04647 [Caenorhabditis remanei]|uniref:Uncharacterized protein n=1 Tax=Caenorhabditis remanei TaxID=31234 RepID=E3LYH1_CAERE|nr:hypothetical protein CRE_04647 [Caenorhabditis remanei]